MTVIISDIKHKERKAHKLDKQVAIAITCKAHQLSTKLSKLASGSLSRYTSK